MPKTAQKKGTKKGVKKATTKKTEKETVVAETPEVKRRGRPKGTGKKVVASKEVKKSGQPPKTEKATKKVKMTKAKQPRTKIDDAELISAYRSVEKQMSTIRKMLKKRLKRKTA